MSIIMRNINYACDNILRGMNKGRYNSEACVFKAQLKYGQDCGSTDFRITRFVDDFSFIEL